MQEIVTRPFFFFLASILFGMGLFFLYDFFRALRMAFHHKPVFVIMEDLFFALFVAVTSFLFLCTYNYGELRGFFFLGIFLGMIVYHIKISSCMISLEKKIFLVIKNVLKILYCKTIRPICGIQRNLKWRLKKQKKNVTIALKKQTKRGEQSGTKEKTE